MVKKFCDYCKDEIINNNFVEVRITRNHMELPSPSSDIKHFHHDCYSEWKNPTPKHEVDTEILSDEEIVNSLKKNRAEYFPRANDKHVRYPD